MSILIQNESMNNNEAWRATHLLSAPLSDSDVSFSG